MMPKIRLVLQANIEQKSNAIHFTRITHKVSRSPESGTGIVHQYLVRCILMVISINIVY